MFRPQRGSSRSGMPGRPAGNPTHRRKASSWFGKRFTSWGGRNDPEVGSSEGGDGPYSPGARGHPNKIRLRRRKTRLARLWDQVRHPLASLRRKFRRCRCKTRLMAAINKHDAGDFDGAWDRIRTEAFLWGQWLFELLSPPRSARRRRLLFTASFPFLLLLVFFFMAGEYPAWVRRSDGRRQLLPTNRGDDDFGPGEMVEWIASRADWRTFDAEFLILWGARFLPAIRDKPERWVLSILVHESFEHVASNVLLFLLLSSGLEAKYGFARTASVCLASGIAGNFVSAAGEDPCALVVGASGCVFGLAGFFIADMLVDFRRVSFPFLKLIGVCAFLAAFAITLATQEETSHLSHAGGFLAGLGLSLSLFRKLIDERVEAATPALSAVTLVTTFVVFPIVVYRNVLPDIHCRAQP